MPVGISDIPCKRIYSPIFIRRVFGKIIQKYGVEAVVKEREHQTDREMWVGATFALGLMQAGNDPIYCGQGVSGDSPDVYGVSIGNNAKGQVAEIHRWEITEYNEFSTAVDIVDHLIETKMWKGYGPEFSVVCYARRPGQSFVPHDAHTRFATKMGKKTYPAVWVVSAVEEPRGGTNHVIAQIWPRVSANLFVPEEVERTLGKGMKDILKPSFGRSLGFTSMGEEEVEGWGKIN